MQKLPSLRRHKPTSQAVVTLSGHDHNLGTWPASRKTAPPAIQFAYERLIAEWLAGNRQPLTSPSVAGTSSNPIPMLSDSAGDEALTIAGLLVAYWNFAETYYRKPDGSPSPELICLRAALGPLRMDDDLPAAAFSPLKLKGVRETMIDTGLTRATINRNVGRVKRVFALAVENELVPPAISHGLHAVKGLKAGRSGAKEGRKVQPAHPELVEQTLPHLPPIVADIVRVQLLTRMRSTEVCRLQPSDIDRSADVWEYRPAEHKTAHRGKERVVSIGPKAQGVRAPHLGGLGPIDFVFSPARSEARRRAEAAARRKTARWRSHQARNRKKRKVRPRRVAAERYTRTIYWCSVTRGCERAFPVPPDLARGKVADACRVQAA
jgi:integrase